MAVQEYAGHEPHKTGGTDATVEHTKRLVERGLLLLVVMLGMGLRLWRLDSESLWYDEIITADVSQRDPQSILEFSREQAGNPPLTFLVTHVSFALAGHNEFGARLPAALFGIMSIPIVYALGKILWTRWVGLVAAFLLSINYYHVQYSQDARPYSLMVFLAMMSVFLLVRAVENKKIALWVAFALTTSLGLYNHYFSFLLFPGEIVLGAWTLAHTTRASIKRKQQRSDHPLSQSIGAPARQVAVFLLSLLLIGALYLPWVTTLLAQFPKQLASPSIGISAPAASSSAHFLHLMFVHFGGRGRPFILLWLGLFLVGLVASQPRAAAFAAMAMLTPCAFLAVIVTEHPAESRYVLFSLPIYLLVVSNGLLRVSGWLGKLVDRSRARAGWGSAATHAALATLFATLSLAALGRYYETHTEDWRGAAEYLAQNMSNNDIVIADGQGYGGGGDSERASLPLSYYFGRYGIRAEILRAGRGLHTGIVQSAEPGSGVWGVLWHSFDILTTEDSPEGAHLVDFHRVTVVRPPDNESEASAQASSVVETLLAIQPLPEGRFDLHLALAELRQRAGKPEEAAAQVLLAEGVVRDHLAQAAPDSTLTGRSERWKPYWDLGKIYQQLGMQGQAAAAYQQVVTINPGHAQAYMQLGRAYGHLGEPYKALSAYQRAVDAEPQNPNLRVFLGGALQSLDRTEEATLAYEQALALDPAHGPAKAQLTLLSHLSTEDIPHHLFRSLAGQMNLLGYDLHPPRPQQGGSLEVTLWWQSLADMDRDYTAFVHVVGPDGQLCAQQDTLLQHDGLPTSDWGAGMLVKGTCQLQLPIEATPGYHTMLLGVYHWATGERLAVWDSQGVRAPEDAIVLSRFTLEP